MKYINNFLNLFLHADKVLHFVAGFIITLLSYWIFNFDPWVCFGIGMTLGLAKEMGWDYFMTGHINWLDWFATIAGSLLAVWIL